MARKAKPESTGELNFIDQDGITRPYIAPNNKMDLRNDLEKFFGVKMAYKDPCPGHVTPMDIFWEAWTAKTPIFVLKASRAYGKTTLISNLANFCMLYGSEAIALAGSLDQALLIKEESDNTLQTDIEVEGNILESPFFKHVTACPKLSTRMNTGGRFRAIPASMTGVRGKRCQRLILDECDEMEVEILDAALGIPYEVSGKLPVQTIMASTHQYVGGTMSKLIDEYCPEKGWPIYESCWRDCLDDRGGYKTMEQIDRIRETVPQHVWEIEYELQEPNVSGRIFTQSHIDQMFSIKSPQVKGTEKIGEEYRFRRYSPDGKYVTGVDWAKKQDYTIIVTLRYDTMPAELVAYRRVQAPYDIVARMVDERANYYNSTVVQDELGVGAAASDQLTTSQRIVGFKAIGAKRLDLYNAYISGVQQENILCPKLNRLMDDHKYLVYSDFVGTGHVPDGVSAMAMAWSEVKGISRFKVKKHAWRKWN